MSLQSRAVKKQSWHHRTRIRSLLHFLLRVEKIISRPFFIQHCKMAQIIIAILVCFKCIIRIVPDPFIWRIISCHTYVANKHDTRPSLASKDRMHGRIGIFSPLIVLIYHYQLNNTIGKYFHPEWVNSTIYCNIADNNQLSIDS